MTEDLRAMYDRYGGLVLHLATRLLGDGPDAERIVRDTFTAAWTHRDSYRPDDGSVLRWLLGTALQVYAEAYDRDGASPQPPDRKIVLRTVDELIVADELARLPEDQRRCLHLAIDRRCTAEQITELTGLDPDTVRAHLRQGIQELRRRLEADGAAPESGPSD
jgi:RNA polymerase sigma-70 factor (ECF subfamily)